MMTCRADLDEACERLEAELCRADGHTTILLVGGRRSGKTTVCETVFSRMERHIVRWTPYDEFVVGHVAAAYSGLQTIVFVDDADVLVRLAKGSSVGLVDAMEACKSRAGVRIVLTALDTKGRVWRSVASRAGVVQVIQSSSSSSRGVAVVEQQQQQGVPRARGVRRERESEDHAWDSVLRVTERAVVARTMRNWCDAKDADEEEEDTQHGKDEIDGYGGGDLERDGRSRGEPSSSLGEDAADGGCVVRKIAQILLSAAASSSTSDRC